MNFLEQLNRDLNQYHLIKSPFYQKWSAGQLNLSILQTYAKDYYPHVAAFPRYISSIHAQCDSLAARQILSGNLMEEEQGEENHPELWIRFAEGLGCARNELETACPSNAAKALVEGYFSLTRRDFATGLGALYAYERQTPEVSVSKAKGLRKFYGITDSKTLQFFTTHMVADEWHTEECAKIIDGLEAAQKDGAYQGAMAGARLLWQFLESMDDMVREKQHAH